MEIGSRSQNHAPRSAFNSRFHKELGRDQPGKFGLMARGFPTQPVCPHRASRWVAA